MKEGYVMKGKYIICSMLLLGIIICNTGCWSVRELNELAIASALGVDKIKNKIENKYLVTAQVVNPGEFATKSAGGTHVPVSIYSFDGNTIFEAFRKMTTVAPRKVYIAQLKILVISEKLAEEGIGKALDIFTRQHEKNLGFYIIIAKDSSAKNVLDILTSIENIPANKMFNSLEASMNNWAASNTITIDQLVSDIISEGKEPVITGIRITGDPGKGGSNENVTRIQPLARLQYIGLAALRKDKLVGWLNENESKGYNYTQGNVKSTVISVSCGEYEKIGVEIVRTEAKIKANMENGKPRAEFKIIAEGNIGDVQCKDIDLSKVETINKLEAKVENEIKNLIELAFKKAQNDFKSDIFGIGEAIHRSNPKAWKDLKENWDKEFVNTHANVTVDVTLRYTGTVNNSFLKHLKE